MDIVEFKHNLNNHVLYQDIITNITTKLCSIPNIASLKGDIELILYICNVTENIVKKGNKIDKKALVIQILINLFQLSQSEQDIAGHTIEFLFNNKKIKAIHIMKKCFKYLGTWFVKKIL
jgi:hypothetical protein